MERNGTERAIFTKASSMPTRLRYLFLCATIFGAAFLLISISNISDVVLNNNILFIPWDQDQYEVNTDTDHGRFTIKTEGCHIPLLKPFDKAVKKFVKYPIMSEVCPNSSLSYLDNNRTHIWVRNENKNFYNLSDEENIMCCYQSFYRPLSIEDITSNNNDERVQYNDCTYFDQVIEAKDEFVRVTCPLEENKFYKQYYIFAHKKHLTFNFDQEIKNKSNYNVIVMGIDAVSRLNFHRTMPKTLAYLQEKGAVELLGYNKVGDNTFPNIIPMLMGISEQELKTTCTPNPKSTFDNCPFIWGWFREAGFYTAFGEDSSNLGSFNYVKQGFLGSPTDYYIHTFINEAEHNAGMVKDFNSYLCMNDKYFYEILLDYINNLTINLKTEKLFGFFWEVTMSHDYLNYPMLIDENYVRFFKKLDEAEYLNNTVFFLVSDHGIRWGDIRSTKQGRLEERLPFVYILIPEKFRESYTDAYDNLKSNSRRLTTPYDVHATLSDLVDLNQIENANLSLRKHDFYSRKRGISLFLPVPSNRTCSMASIDDHWCTCHRTRSILTSSIEALEAGGELIRKLNSLIQNYKQCAQLKLTEIVEVNAMETGNTEKNEETWHEYVVVIRVSPGGGLFEATLRRYPKEWTLEGTISRLNLYGEQSHCVHNYQIKLYCYCL